MMMKTRIDTIHIGSRHREPDTAKVKEIAKSISEIGLLNPPAVCLRDGEGAESEAVLIYGRHRLAALKLNGEEYVECVVIDADDVRAELMEIAENLHRADLTALQRDEQVARWIELTEGKKRTEIVSAQIAPKCGRPESGINAAARELGIERTAAQRAVKVASLAAEAKAAAVEAGVDNNRSVLLAAAKYAEPQKQVEVISAHAKPAARTVTPEEEERSRQRDERHRKELAAFMAEAKAMETLLAEIEHTGYAGDDDEIEVPLPYEGLTYIEFAQRYRPIVAAQPCRWSSGYGGPARDASRRVESAQKLVFHIMGGKARDDAAKVAREAA